MGVQQREVERDLALEKLRVWGHFPLSIGFTARKDEEVGKREAGRVTDRNGERECDFNAAHGQLTPSHFQERCHLKIKWVNVTLVGL